MQSGEGHGSVLGGVGSQEGLTCHTLVQGGAINSAIPPRTCMLGTNVKGFGQHLDRHALSCSWKCCVGALVFV